MQKKGATHTDWMISAGIFIIYVVALFVILKPGVIPIHKQDNLLQFLEQKVEEKTSTIIKELPFKITKCSGQSQREKTTLTIKDETRKWSATKVTIEDRVENAVKAGEIQLDCTGQREEYTNKQGIGTFSSKQLAESPNFISTCSPSEELCIVTLGISTELTGFDKKKLEEYSAKDYDTLKQEWNYPLEKDFLITIESENIQIGNKQEKPDQQSTFVKQVKTNLLDEKGEKTPITINYQVW